MAQLKIRLVKSISGRIQKHIATAESLGLRKIGQTVVKEDNACIHGQIFRVKHMIDVKEING